MAHSLSREFTSSYRTSTFYLLILSILWRVRRGHQRHRLELKPVSPDCFAHKNYLAQEFRISRRKRILPFYFFCCLWLLKIESNPNGVALICWAKTWPVVATAKASRIRLDKPLHLAARFLSAWSRAWVKMPVWLICVPEEICPWPGPPHTRWLAAHTISSRPGVKAWAMAPISPMLPSSEHTISCLKPHGDSDLQRCFWV